jgi:hypothetical protein
MCEKVYPGTENDSSDFGFGIWDFGFKKHKTLLHFGFRIEYFNELDSILIKNLLDRICRILLFPNFPERKLGNSIRLRRKLTSY